jgi:hypothetical protein
MIKILKEYLHKDVRLYLSPASYVQGTLVKISPANLFIRDDFTVLKIIRALKPPLIIKFDLVIWVEPVEEELSMMTKQ